MQWFLTPLEELNHRALHLSLLLLNRFLGLLDKAEIFQMFG